MGRGQKRARSSEIDLDLMTRVLLRAYALSSRARLFDVPWIGGAFSATYFLYKRLVEDPYSGLCRRRPELFLHGNVIDVGANIGYTALEFSRAVAPGDRVFAFEPEHTNFQRLVRNLERWDRHRRVIAVESAVGQEVGMAELARNDDHPGDHRVLTPSLTEAMDTSSRATVPITTLDDFAVRNGILDSISFVKIDVQGYELPVSLGMREIARANPRLTVGFEYSPGSMMQLGFEALDLLRFYRERFNLFLLSRGGGIRSVAGLDLQLAMMGKPYVNFLALPRNA